MGYCAFKDETDVMIAFHYGNDVMECYHETDVMVVQQILQINTADNSSRCMCYDFGALTKSPKSSMEMSCNGLL